MRPRLATLTAMRPPGSSVRTHSANTSVSISRYSRYDDGHAVAFELLLVLLAGEVRRRRDDERDRPVGDAVHVAGVAVHERVLDRTGARRRSRRRRARAARTARRTACVVALAPPAPKFEVEVLRRLLAFPALVGFADGPLGPRSLFSGVPASRRSLAFSALVGFAAGPLGPRSLLGGVPASDARSCFPLWSASPPGRSGPARCSAGYPLLDARSCSRARVGSVRARRAARATRDSRRWPFRRGGSPTPGVRRRPAQPLVHHDGEPRRGHDPRLVMTFRSTHAGSVKEPAGDSRGFSARFAHFASRSEGRSGHAARRLRPRSAQSFRSEGRSGPRRPLPSAPVGSGDYSRAE